MYNGTMDTKTTQQAIDYALTHDVDETLLVRLLMQTRTDLFMKIVKFDVQQVVADLIQTDPTAYIQLAGDTVIDARALERIKIELKSTNIVGATKELRAATGLGLKEAKDIVCLARDDLITAGKLTKHQGYATPSTQTLPPEEQALRNAIVESFA